MNIISGGIIVTLQNGVRTDNPPGTVVTLPDAEAVSLIERGLADRGPDTPPPTTPAA